MIISVHQPMYLPWIGYFNKILHSDVFVILDNVEFSKNDWFNRNQIKTANGELWLTIPIIYKNNSSTIIREMIIDNKHNWRKKHLNSIIQNYSKAQFYSDFIDDFKDIYAHDWELLIDINMHTIRFVLDKLEIKTKVVLASDLSLNERSTERLVEICKKLNADSYLSGTGAINYILPEVFEKNGIKLFFQEFNHPKYKQLYGPFVSHLSIIDLLMNCGSSKSLEVIKNV